MKKLILGVAACALLFASCETEPIANETLVGVAGKAEINGEDDGCETAFGRYCECASQNTCFSDFGINRWGWAVELNSYNSYRFNLFAGAGQCDWEFKGEYVGYVMVTFNNDGISYGEPNMEPGWELKEFHFYSGDSEMPLKKNGSMTAAPGKYTDNGDVNEDGTVYVIVHTVVCEESV